MRALSQSINLMTSKILILTDRKQLLVSNMKMYWNSDLNCLGSSLWDFSYTIIPSSIKSPLIADLLVYSPNN